MTKTKTKTKTGKISYKNCPYDRKKLNTKSVLSTNETNLPRYSNVKTLNGVAKLCLQN